MATAKKLPSTQEHLDIEDIRDDVVLLKSGNASAVIQTTAVNFNLLSEDEQDSLILAFAALLNSLTFPVQVLVRSKRLDISNYLARIEAAKRVAQKPQVIAQLDKYQSFIRDLVAHNQVLDKRFYVAIPYIGIDISQLRNIGGVFTKRPPTINRGDLLVRAKANLDPKIDHLIRGFGRISIEAVRLSTQELVELYYDVYNPEVAREQKAALDPHEYATPIVEPALAPPSEGLPKEGGK
jgi:hypothetical protein